MNRQLRFFSRWTGNNTYHHVSCRTWVCVLENRVGPSCLRAFQGCNVRHEHTFVDEDAMGWLSVAAKSLHLGVQEKCQSKVCLFYPRHGTTWTWCSSKNLAAESFKVEDALCKTSDDTVSWLQKWRNQHSMNQRERHIEGLVFLVNLGSKP